MTRIVDFDAVMPTRRAIEVLTAASWLGFSCSCTPISTDQSTRLEMRGESRIELAQQFYVPRIGREFDAECRAYRDLAEFRSVNPDFCSVRHSRVSLSAWDPGALLRDGSDSPIVLIGFRCDGDRDVLPVGFKIAEVNVNNSGRVMDATASISPEPYWKQ